MLKGLKVCYLVLQYSCDKGYAFNWANQRKLFREYVDYLTSLYVGDVKKVFGFKCSDKLIHDIFVNAYEPYYELHVLRTLIIVLSLGKRIVLSEEDKKVIDAFIKYIFIMSNNERRC